MVPLAGALLTASFGGCEAGITPCTSETCEVAEAGTLRTEWTESNALSGSTNEIYYRFYLERDANLSLTVDGLQDYVQVDIIRDSNGNGLNDDGPLFSEGSDTSLQSTDVYSSCTYYLHLFGSAHVATGYHIEMIAYPVPAPTPEPSPSEAAAPMSER